MDLPGNVVEYSLARIGTGTWQAVSERYLKRVAAALLLMVMAGGSVQAQESGGVLRIYHRDSPASMSIHEEGTNSGSIPMMAVFNNLVLYDQQSLRPHRSGEPEPIALGSFICSIAVNWFTRARFHSRYN